jgi:V/A-type H+-transporting ATPase subunit E
MGLDKVVEEILRRGEEKKQEIIRLGEKERDELVGQADKKIADNRQKSEKKAETTIVQMEQQELSSAELESKKALLAAQRQVMEDLKQQVLDALGGYPAEKKKKLYAKLAARARKELGECYVYSNREDKAVLQLPSGVTDAGTIDCHGGLVFESKDRSYRLDYRFESMLDEVWNKEMKEIFTKLFG